MTEVPGETAVGYDSAKVERFDDNGNPMEDEGESSDVEDD